MKDNIYERERAPRGRAARDIMDTPKKALNVARAASWTSFGLAAGSAVEVVKWINFGGVGVILAVRPAALETAELAATIVAGGLAYSRPAPWSISIVLALLGLDAAYQVLSHGFNSTFALDAVFALFAMMSFQGVRRYAELRGDAANQHAGTVFD